MPEEVDPREERIFRNLRFLAQEDTVRLIPRGCDLEILEPSPNPKERFKTELTLGKMQAGLRWLCFSPRTIWERLEEQ